MIVIKAPKNIVEEYIEAYASVDDFRRKMNDIYSNVEDIRKYQKLFTEKENEIDENLNGKWVEYINIDPYGEPSIKKRKIKDGKWEEYRDYLITIPIQK